MFNIFNKKKNKRLYAFATGVSVDLKDVQDEVFSQKMMGEGIAIKPSEGKIYSPCDGTIVVVMKESKHAVGIKTKDGVESLIHVGIDTVTLNGEGFELHCEEGKAVKKGDLLISFDRNFIKEKGLDDITMLIISNANDNKITNFNVGKDMKAKESPLIEFK
ncbi:PTS system glucose-specific IIA component [Clostridium saccharoperbutylacetonicum]|uniref:Putative PTS system glucosamine-specific EIICBA component GamP n=1 Tax=Clostridium saccharoperbutylacetonicum N1-4(HMT) TaxID=931276 RepID=M1N5Z5_9CLOT|nr:PTS glucose transporter subunit IIA [Clostridium saccharoperbutylacetonicum]AGF58812.1 putative PTS system glucosamine-specific EIICBA component GamP [Clostridium saccharoperbutylacetonicum N1-4(HMT)]NRT60404.1 PTS system glucose-specific IIA component [Clostridium saccharoperbutylacetonicum]NSB23717.1 PTS system glucose-specific IIA component [Clostridium saccharoperbutylacetonicum]NSB43091.1 PTS system glucose-specific IIA component [Clostridium saccharoperbutylacetonicum]